MSADKPSAHTPHPVADYYNRHAESWDESYGVGRQNQFFARQLRDNLRLMLSNIACDARALELGAGTGAYVEITASMIGHLIATDWSVGMLAVFARRLIKLGLTNVTLMQEDACELTGITPQNLDVVYSIGLLETIADFDRLFGAVRRVLKPGGIVAGITSNGDCPWYIVRRWVEGGERHGRTTQLATAALLSEVLGRSGFDPPEITYWGATPPGLQSRVLGATLTAAESLIAPTPLARYLGALTFRARKA